MNELGELLRQARLDAGITQRQAALETNHSEVAVNRLENGKRVPSTEFLLALCDLYGITSTTDRDSFLALSGHIDPDIEGLWLNDSSFRKKARSLIFKVQVRDL